MWARERLFAAVSRLDRWVVTSIICFLALAPIVARMALDSGISWDEEVQRQYGQHILAWYRTQFTDRSAVDFRNLYLYGGLFDLPAEWLLSTGLSPWGAYETRHVLSALIAWLALVPVWKAARRIAGPRAGFIAGAMLALTPTWVGHGLFNPKDIPFGTAAAFVLDASVSIVVRGSPLRWSDALYAGAALGCALGVRSGGMFLVAYPLMAAFGCVTVDAIRSTHARDARRLASVLGVSTGRSLVMLLIAWVLMISTWPWAQLDPLVRPFEAAAIAAKFDWGGIMRFDGGDITTDNIPLRYLPVWFQVTLPDIYALAAACGLLAAIRRICKRALTLPRALAIVIVSAFVVLPYLGVVIKRPIVYDAHRHFLFILPALAVLGGLAIDDVLFDQSIDRIARAVVGIIVVGSSVLTLCDMYSLHPYEYVYFNRLSGGLRRQANRFETDYWGTTFREGFDWVVHHVAPGGGKKVRVASCAGEVTLRYYRKEWHAERYVVPKDPDAAEVYLAFMRGPCRNAEGTLLHSVERQGVTLLRVLKRIPKRH